MEIETKVMTVESGKFVYLSEETSSRSSVKQRSYEVKQIRNNTESTVPKKDIYQKVNARLRGDFGKDILKSRVHPAKGDLVTS